MTTPVSGQSKSSIDDFQQTEAAQEQSLVLYENPDTIEPKQTEEESFFKNWASSTASSIWEGVKGVWPFKKEPKKTAFTFKAVMGRDPLDCSVYENALKCLGLTEEEAKDKAKLDDRYQKSASHMVERIDWFKERQHPFLNLFELMLQETESAYRTLIERHHNAM